MPVWPWGWAAHCAGCSRELSQPGCWAQELWLPSKAESCVAVVKSTEPRLMSPLETWDLTAWPRCLCLTQHLCWVGGAKPASKSVSAPPHEPVLFPQGNELTKHAGIPENSAFPSSELIKNHWQIWQLGRSHPWAFCQNPLPEVTTPGHGTCALAHTSAPAGTAHPQLSQGTALGTDLNLPAGCSAWQQPRAELGNF